MCGRFALTSPHDAVRRLFGYPTDHPFPPRYNIAPGQPILVVRQLQERRGREAALVRWGMTARSQPGGKAPPVLINARAETIDEKPTFRAAFRRRRCLVPADAFYEWQSRGTARAQPYLLRRREGGTMALAAIWETWAGPNGEEVDTACIITTAASADTAHVHPRLPAIIAPAAFDTWLETDETRASDLLPLLASPPAGRLEMVALTDVINRTGNDGPQVQRPADEPIQGSLF